MCGIFGGIGRQLNPGIIRALALINRERGTDSLGFFANSGKFIKRAGDPLECLGDDDFADFIEKSCKKGWFLAGHTRFATRGKVTTRNAHPFRFGRIVGCHNGVVTLPAKSRYPVDSEYLFDSLNKANGDYQTAFGEIVGYWALSWFDGCSFYLQAHGGEVSIGCDAFGNWYYSSDWHHLEACTGPLCKTATISNGGTIRFGIKSREYEILPAFVSTVPSVWWGLTEKKEKKGKKAQTGLAETTEESDDPFYVKDDESESWARAVAWEDYTESDARLD